MRRVLTQKEKEKEVLGTTVKFELPQKQPLGNGTIDRWTKQTRNTLQ